MKYLRDSRTEGDTVGNHKWVHGRIIPNHPVFHFDRRPWYIP